MDKETQPIMEFKNNEELNNCLKEWQEILYLNDWIIKAGLHPISEMQGDSGNCAAIFTLKSAYIKISLLDEDLKTRIIKACHEQTLIHELLECIYDRKSGESLEDILLEDYMHSQLEFMARSLLMAKYDLKPSWFINI